MIQPLVFVGAARNWLGVKFLHQGRNRFGVDCIGLVLCAAKDAGLPDAPDTPNYGRAPTERLMAGVRDYCTEARAPTAGCLVLIRWPKKPFPSHVAIYTGQSLIHCDGRFGSVVEHGYRGQWLKWTDSFWLYPGIDYE